MPNHLQIGPSKLALGLLIPVTRSVGFEVHVIGKQGPPEPRSFSVAFAGEGGSLRPFEVASFTSPATLGDLEPSVGAVLSADEPLLITTTLRGAIEERAGLIEAIADARPPASETVFVACENDSYPRYTSLLGFLESRGVRCPRTVVNRICLPPLRPSPAGRTVRAHRTGEWKLQREPLAGTAIARKLVTSREVPVSLVDDIDAHQDLKRWAVNGGQTVLAMYALDAQLSFDGAVARPARQGSIHHFHAAVIGALQVKHPQLTLEQSLDYCLEHVGAICEMPEQIHRIFPFKRGALTEVFRRLDTRVAEPARVLAQHMGTAPPIFARVRQVLESLLIGTDRYLDAEDLRSGTLSLSEDDDRAALDAYRKMLEGWAPSEEIERSARRLAHTLASHRAAGAPATGGG